MNSAVIGLVGISALFLGHRFYSRFLAKSLFRLQDITEPTPANLYNDGQDYVPTKKAILFGHHFSSIAGAAPIVGPAVAVIWGWLPAVLWIVIGVIFMGAAHDFGALVISMKHKGRSIGQVAESLIGPKGRTLFLVIIFFLVWMVIAVFALVISNLFISFPSSVIPVNFEIFVAVLMGVLINKNSRSLMIPSLLAQAALLIMIYIGTIYPLSFKSFLGDYEIHGWMIFLMIYSFIASVLPVHVLLQPRDYINGHQLFLGLGLMILGLFVTRPEVVAPAINPHPVGAPPWFPFLFITIACGAISGFHGLVSSGTSSKQVESWSDTRYIGYGAMCGEGLLALLATLAVTTGFKDAASWHQHYASWGAANGLPAKINAFVMGSSHFVQGLGIPLEFAQTAIAVLIISFAATSLDTATRIQRYVVFEIGESFQFSLLKNKYVGALVATISAAALMMLKSGGKGGLYIWPLFGATNQMLAGLTLLIITLYLKKLKRKYANYLIPTLFIILMTGLGLILNIKLFYQTHNYLLMTLGVILILAQLWIMVQAFLTLKTPVSEKSSLKS